MNVQTIKAMQKIKQTCEEYLHRKSNLIIFQNTLNAIYSSFENDIPQELQNGIHNFIEDLEYIKFMYNQNEQFEAISKKIAKLNDLFSNFSS